MPVSARNILFLLRLLCISRQELLKAYAKTEPATNLTLPEDTPFESVASGSARSADYEIIYVYGKKYIVFSSGSDIEVLEYH